MGRISLSFFPQIPPQLLAAQAHHNSQFQHNANNASPTSFLALIAAVTAGEVLAIFVCKLVADYAEMNFYSTERGAKISPSRRKSLIERALVGCRRRRRLSFSTSSTNGEDDHSCPICLRDFDEESDDVRRPISCSHLYHKSCISEWLLQKDCCPLCRSNVLAAAIEDNPASSNRRHILWTQSSMWGNR